MRRFSIGTKNTVTSSRFGVGRRIEWFLFFSRGVPLCILVSKKCKKFDDVLFVNAVDHFNSGKRQNNLAPEHTDKK